MWRRIKFILLLFILASSLNNLYGQESAYVKDTSRVYRRIEEYSKKRKFTRFLYRLVLRPVATKPVTTAKKKKHRPQSLYKSYEGKIIRNINIVTIDPFGYTVKDTLLSSQNFFPRIGNRLHVRTQHLTIRNLLIIHKNKAFDSLEIKESERLIRSQNYVHDVLFSFQTTKNKNDSVDISVRVLDVWSIVPKIVYTPSHLRIGFNDKNIGGLGHNSDNSYNLNQSNGKQSISANYLIPNFRNSFISSTLNYHSDEENNYITSVDIERPFYSPLARWAGGIMLSRQFLSRIMTKVDSSKFLFRSRQNILDIWGAGSWQIFKGNSIDNRTTRLILSARAISIHYLEKPPSDFDTLHNYADYKIFLLGLGICTREYVKDKYVFNFGVTEDVPVGRTYGIVLGYKYNNTENLYWGIRIAKGNYYPWGYFSANLEYGTYVFASKWKEGVFNADFNYFTALFEIGNWKIRQFIKPGVTVGLKRSSSDILTLNNKQQITGFNSTGLKGTNRILLKLQTQSYAPWNLLGFRFGPYFVFSLGMLGNEYSGFRYSKVYSQIGIGALIKNVYWVINTFQISFSYYPSIPGKGINQFKSDKFKTTDFGFNDFDLQRPGTVAYQ